MFLVALAFAQSVAYVSDLDLSKAIQGWGSPGKDRSVEGHPITIDGKTFRHGFGTHSIGRLVITLDGKASSFTAQVGVDDEVPDGKGSVQFKVLGSHHNTLWESDVMHKGDPPSQVQVPLAGEQSMTLYVSDSGDGYDFDHADWADAKITYYGATPQTATWKPTEPAVADYQAGSSPGFCGPDVIDGSKGVPFSWAPSVSAASSYTAPDGLPPGLSLDAKTGIVSGAIPEDGLYTFELDAANHSGHAKRTYTLNVGRGVAETPPMGWNSYDGFGDSVTETEVLANAKALQSKLLPYGWNTVVVDYRWYDPGAHDNNANARAGAKLSMDQYGRLIPAPNRFPSGFEELADEVHKMGMKFGIHIMRGIPREAVEQNLPIEGTTYSAQDAANTDDKCPWCADMYGVRADTPAGQAYYESIFRLYDQWGVDFVKMDDTSSPYHTDEIEAVDKAIAECSHPIVYSLSPGETPIDQADHVTSHANMWRVSGDFWDNWSSLNREFTLADEWHMYVGASHWPDADMLPVGKLSIGGRSVGPERLSNFSHAELVTLMSLWCLLPSPLMLGGDLTKLDPYTVKIITNPEVLALDQDYPTFPAYQLLSSGDLDFWMRPMSDGGKVLAIFNRGESDQPYTIPATMVQGFKVRDLWLHKTLTPSQITIPSHGCILYRLSR